MADEAEYRDRLLAITSVAGDLWNELENLREYWQDTPKSSLIQEYIDTYEKAAGIGVRT